MPDNDAPTIPDGAQPAPGGGLTFTTEAGDTISVAAWDTDDIILVCPTPTTLTRRDATLLVHCIGWEVGGTVTQETGR